MSRVYFCFSQSDYNSATIINNACKFKQVARAVFFDRTIWNEATKKGDKAITELVDKAVTHTDVTVFLIGANTYVDKWCRYARKKSVESKRGMFGIYLPNQMQQGRTDWLTGGGVPVYEWDSNSLKSWIISAVQKSLERAS